MQIHNLIASSSLIQISSIIPVELTLSFQMKIGWLLSCETLKCPQKEGRRIIQFPRISQR